MTGRASGQPGSSSRCTPRSRSRSYCSRRRRGASGGRFTTWPLTTTSPGRNWRDCPNATGPSSLGNSVRPPRRPQRCLQVHWVTTQRLPQPYDIAPGASQRWRSPAPPWWAAEAPRASSVARHHDGAEVRPLVLCVLTGRERWVGVGHAAHVEHRMCVTTVVEDREVVHGSAKPAGAQHGD